MLVYWMASTDTNRYELGIGHSPPRGRTEPATATAAGIATATAAGTATATAAGVAARVATATATAVATDVALTDSTDVALADSTDVALTDSTSGQLLVWVFPPTSIPTPFECPIAFIRGTPKPSPAPITFPGLPFLWTGRPPH